MSLTTYKSTEKLFKGIPSSYFLNILQKFYPLLTIVLLLSSTPLFSQVGVGTTDPKATLDIRSTSQSTPSNTDGILIPKVDNFPLSNPTIFQDGMMVYTTGNGTPTKGFYYWDNGADCWKQVEGVKKIDELSDGKSDSNGSSLFLGLQAGFLDDGTNNQNVGVGYKSLYSNVGANKNTALGYASLYSNDDGTNNTAVGYNVLRNNLAGNSNTAIGSESLRANTANYNTAIGSQTLKANNTGFFNTAIGFSALISNVAGYNNTAIGANALNQNIGNLTDGHDNTAIGYQSLFSNTLGRNNTAMGSNSLNANVIGNFNTADGFEALKNNIQGNSNTATGARALSQNMGDYNTAHGAYALYLNGNGQFNTASGFEALYNNISGQFNTANGSRALYVNSTGNYNTAYGTGSLLNLLSGEKNTAVGNESLSNMTSGSNNIAIGNNAQVPNSTGSNQVRIGDSNITIAEVQVPWISSSDRRWKENIRVLPYGLNMVTALQPVDYIRKNNDLRTREVGFIAQDVKALLEKLGYTDQGLLNTDDNGYFSLRYNDFIPVLVKAVQEQQKMIEDLQKENDAFKENYSANNEKTIELENRLKKLEVLLINKTVSKN